MSKQGNSRAKPARKSDPAKPDPKAPGLASNTAEPDIHSIIMKAKAKRDAMDRRTGGQYSALCELERAFRAVLETQAGKETYTWADAAATAAADALELDLLRRPARVDKSRQALLKTGFNAPDEWLTCPVDYYVERPRGPHALAPDRPGHWHVYWGAAPDPAALDLCIREIRAAIMRLSTPTANACRNTLSTVQSQAWDSYQWFCETYPNRIPPPPDMYTTPMWHTIKQECPAYKSDADGAGKMPSFQTWARYVREARLRLEGPRNMPRRGRTHGATIVEAEQT